MKIATVFWVFFLCVIPNLAAQELDQRSTESAWIYHVEGEDFVLTQRGERMIFSAEAARRERINLERSVTVNTGADTLLELQLVPSGTVIKLAESTSLIYNGIDESGKFAEFGLLYGRIRVVTGAGMNSAAAASLAINSIVVRSGGVSVRLGEGDLGVDYMLEPLNISSAMRPVLRLYAFRSSAEVFPHGGGGTPANFGGARSLTAEEGSSLFFDVSPSYTFAEKKALDSDIISYWRAHNFTGLSPRPMPDTAIAETPPPAAFVPSSPVSEIVIIPNESRRGSQELPVVNKNRGRNLLLFLGVGLTASSSAVLALTDFQPGIFDSMANPGTIHNAAYVPLTLGLITTLAGILYNPSPGR